MKREPVAETPTPATGKEFECLAPPCRTACPADMDIPGFLRAVARGDHGAAWHIIHRDNLFPTVLGWICPRPCEDACRLGQAGAPVPVCQIKRWVTASHTPPSDLIRTRRPHGPRVAVVGAGPAGLAAAHDLALAGLEVTVLDRNAYPGGLLTSCIPDFRLPRWAASGDIARVFSLGIRFEPHFVLRSSAQLTSLLEERGFAGVLLATGPGDDREPRVSGWRRSAASSTAIAFLQEARAGAPSMKGMRVVIVGGGNGAIDAARSALRRGAGEVRILYRRRRRDMPAFPEEIEAAEREGVAILPQTVVAEIVWDGPALRGVRCAAAHAEGHEAERAIGEFLPCEAIVFAIGQSPTRVDVAAEPHVFSCADTPAAVGTVVTAIATGRRTAARMIEDLAQRGLLPDPARGLVSIESLTPARSPSPHANGQAYRNGAQPSEPVERIGQGSPFLLPHDIATHAARRCLSCDSLLALDPELCIACGLCAQMCAFDALAWTRDEDPSNGAWRLTIHDPACQRCGDCVAVCPAGALEWTSWTHPNRSCLTRTIHVAHPADGSSNCSGGAV